MQMNKNTV